MEQPFISVILPAYKVEFLNDAICSILNQTYRNFELVIVDDASPNNLELVVNSFTDSRIKYLKNEVNIGGDDLVRQWNEFCLPNATGEYVVFASDDDVYEPMYLEEMVNLSVKYPEVDLFHCRGKVINGNNDLIDLFAPSSEYETCLDFICQRICNNRKQTVQEFMFRRSAMNGIGGFVKFPLAFFTDDATWSLLAKNGVACSKNFLFSFRNSNINISSNNDTQYQMIKKLEACFLYTEWLKDFLENYVSSDQIESILKPKLYASIKIKRVEWINWTTCRCSLKTFYSIMKNKLYRKECNVYKWIFLLIKNLQQRLIK